MGKRQSLQQMLLGKLASRMQINEVRKHPCATNKSKLKWLKYLNIRQDKIKLPEENIGKTFSDINSTNVFLGQSPKTIEGKKAKINKGDLIKLITFSEQKKVTIKKTKTTYGLEKNICK